MRSKLFGNVLCLPVVVVAALAMVAGTAAHAANLVQNGGFESATAAPGQLAFDTTVTDWSVPALNGSYAFLYAPGTADTTGSNSEYGNVQLWGPGNGSANGLPATSPDGGNYIAIDGAFQNGALTQTITGLTAGQSYKLTFDWAGAQQFTFTGPTTEGWVVSLGGETQNTTVVNNVNHGFTGWTTTSMTFTADGPSDVLSFLAVGTPDASEPPFTLLDGVSLTTTTTPEPSSLALLATGLFGAGGMLRKRFAK